MNRDEPSRFWVRLELLPPARFFAPHPITGEEKSAARVMANLENRARPRGGIDFARCAREAIERKHPPLIGAAVDGSSGHMHRAKTMAVDAEQRFVDALERASVKAR